ncbi:hypothetical protein [Poritiphilus flavus]|uniref:Uncharacterized protein n=1 Tax=Poritiphilus flavus TaxID=2697053 RepID=A0A6L9EBX8_9FLAO|nr:hypothetical protein [Poritiphilus flavus]NAS12215.1 hypothetical protein [Poritiphilus flavus]
MNNLFRLAGSVTKSVPFISILLIFIFVACSNDEEKVPESDPSIVFSMGSVEINEISRGFMLSVLASHKISYYDTVYEKPKNLVAFKLRDVLELGYEINLDTIRNSTFTFLALDGFQDSASSHQANEPGGYIAFEDLDVEGLENWEPVAIENNNNPAPFYVVWINEGQTPEDGYPWPYQLYAIDKD